MNQKIIITFTFFLIRISSFSQEVKELTLNEVIEIACTQSLDAFRAKNMYFAEYWKYRTYKASLLPALDLNLRPVQYNRAMSERYDFEQNADVFREQKSIYSVGSLSLTQNISRANTQIFLDSDLSRLLNFGDTNIITYNATLLRLGIKQQLWGFNDMKWQKKIAPKEFEKAKKDFIKNQQEIKLSAVKLYFDLLLAGMRLEIAENNVKTSDTLYTVGKQKFDILSVQYQELLELELSKFNAEIDAVQAKQNLQKSQMALNSFLGLELTDIIKPILESDDAIISINAEDALARAKKNNPLISELELNELKADAELEKTKKESGINADFIASYGLNQNANTAQGAYKSPLTQQVFLLTLQIPLVDWGNRRGKRLVAEKNKEVQDIENRQALNIFEQEVMMKVSEFSLQKKITESSLKASNISEEAYRLTTKRFLLGEADVMKLNDAIKQRTEARENYIVSIYNYWKFYYEIQKMTMFDYKKNMPIDINFDRLTEKQ